MSNATLCLNGELMKKIFCLDTNVLLYDPLAFNSFEDNDVVIPMIVLEEIDSVKNKRADEVGRNARLVNRYLDDLRKQGSLLEGVTLPGGGVFRIIRTKSSTSDLIPNDLDKDKADNLIISAAIELQSSTDVKVILITKDISMRIKCDILKVPCDDYLKHRVAGQADGIYGGVRVSVITQNKLNEFYQKGHIEASDIDEHETLVENEYIVLKSGESASGLARFQGGIIKQITQCNEAWGLKPRNKEQKFALDMLTDDNIKLCTLIGQAGTGKTLLTIAAGIKQVLEDKKYSKLIVTRPIQPLGRDIGYLPGTKEEKMEPWVQPIMDNLENLFVGKKARDSLEMYFDQGLIEVEAITYIRGRSISNAYIIIDEAQNLTVHELKTIITRVGDKTKIILTGDIDQIDNDKIDALSNGLTYAVEKFKQFDLSGHITLIKGERSVLASLASQIL